MNADREYIGLCVTVGILLLCNYNRVAVIPTWGSGMDGFACETDGQSKEERKKVVAAGEISRLLLLTSFPIESEIIFWIQKQVTTYFTKIPQTVLKNSWLRPRNLNLKGLQTVSGKADSHASG